MTAPTGKEGLSSILTVPLNSEEDNTAPRAAFRTIVVWLAAR